MLLTGYRLLALNWHIFTSTSEGLDRGYEGTIAGFFWFRLSVLNAGMSSLWTQIENDVWISWINMLDLSKLRWLGFFNVLEQLISHMIYSVHKIFTSFCNARLKVTWVRKMRLSFTHETWWLTDVTILFLCIPVWPLMAGLWDHVWTPQTT